MEKVNIYDNKIDTYLDSNRPDNKNLNVLLSERSFNDLKLLKFEDLVANDNNASIESLNNITNELEKQVNHLKESDFDHRLKQSFHD